MSSSLYKLYEQLGELETQSIVFFDLVDSTYLKKQLGHSEGVSIALKHNRVAANTCQRFKGRVIKQIGDAIMVVFNTPIEGLLASLKFIETIRLEQLPFRTKIGFVHGIVKRVNINGSDYYGNAVDLSARLTSAALPNQLITDETTMNLIKPFWGDMNEVISRYLGVRELKGLGKIPIYELSLENLGFVSDNIETNGVRESPSSENVKPEPVTDVIFPSFAITPSEPVSARDTSLSRMLNTWRISKQDLDSIAINYQNVCHIIKSANELNIREVSFSGTFARGTMIKPLEAIDIIAKITPSKDQSINDIEIAKKLALHISKGYPDSVNINNKNHVCITLQGVQFEVIPVLAITANGKSQLMISKGNFWIACNPSEPEQWVKHAVQRHGPNFLPFLHLLKMWQRTNCSIIKSYHLELLTDFVASQSKLDLSFESLYQWFLLVYTIISKKKKPFIRDPFSPNIYVDDYLFSNASTFNMFSRSFTESYNIAIHGINYYHSGNMNKALSKFRTLFREYWIE